MMTIKSEKSTRIRIECNPYFADNAEDWLNRNGYTIHGTGPLYLGNDTWDDSITLITAYKIDTVREHEVCTKSFMPCVCNDCKH